MSASIHITIHQLHLVNSKQGFIEEVYSARMENPNESFRNIYDRFEKEHFDLVGFYRYSEFRSFYESYKRYVRKLYKQNKGNKVSK